MAALISAITAVIGLLLAVFGVPFVGGSSVNRTVADGAATAPASSTSAPAEMPTTGSPKLTAEPGTVPPASSRPSPPAIPKGWHRVSASDLTVAFALPDGWIQKDENDIQSTWKSPDDTHDMSIKRDTSYGSTVKAASVGQLAWYRDTDKSSMADLKAVTHPTRQNGRNALWLEIDYHYVRQSEPRKRVELFVAGKSGQVYQLLFDTAASPEKLNQQGQMFATARAQLLVDWSTPA